MSGCYDDYARYKHLNPYAFRLMAHFLALNVCCQSTSTLARETGMGAGTICKYRDELLDAGHITITPMTPTELVAAGLLDEATGDTNEVFVVTPVHHREGVREMNATRQDGVHQSNATRDENAPAQPKGLLQNASQNGGSSRGVHQPNQVFKDSSIQDSLSFQESLSVGVTTHAQGSNKVLGRIGAADTMPILSDPEKALIQAWIDAHPEKLRPLHPYSRANSDHARAALSAGLTPAQIAAKTREKLAQPRDSAYLFRFAVEDAQAALIQQVASTPPVQPSAAQQREDERARRFREMDEQARRAAMGVS